MDGLCESSPGTGVGCVQIALTCFKPHPLSLSLSDIPTEHSPLPYVSTICRVVFALVCGPIHTGYLTIIAPTGTLTMNHPCDPKLHPLPAPPLPTADYHPYGLWLGARLMHAHPACHHASSGSQHGTPAHAVPDTYTCRKHCGHGIAYLSGFIQGARPILG